MCCSHRTRGAEVAGIRHLNFYHPNLQHQPVRSSNEGLFIVPRKDAALSKVVYLPEQEKLLEFAKTAAAHFESHPKHYSYGGLPDPGEYLALRWGSHMRAVLVLKLDEYFEPTIYGDLIPYSAPEFEPSEGRR